MYSQTAEGSSDTLWACMDVIETLWCQKHWSVSLCVQSVSSCAAGNIWHAAFVTVHVFLHLLHRFMNSHFACISFSSSSFLRAGSFFSLLSLYLTENAKVLAVTVKIVLKK